jgi:NADPH-dependent curcumin reductase CurA
MSGAVHSLPRPIIAREVHLVRRPHGFPEHDDFALVDRELSGLGDGEVLVANHHFSVDPYMRGRMNDIPSYVAPYALDEVMDGRAIGEVLASTVVGIAVGDVVRTNLGWRTHGIAPATGVERLDVPDGVPPSAYLGVLGVPGLTAWVGLLDVAGLQAGDTVFVSAAAGAVGSLVGQLARLKGASRVIGSAGSSAKVAWLTDELGFDAAFSYRDAPVRRSLRAAAPRGIDVYFDNVGHDHLEAALASANDFARFAICGMIAGYNDTADQRSPGVGNLAEIVRKRLAIRGFIVTDSLGRNAAFLQEVAPWVAQGCIRYRETAFSGIEHAVDAFRGLLRGENTGKTLVTL